MDPLMMVRKWVRHFLLMTNPSWEVAVLKRCYWWYRRFITDGLPLLLDDLASLNKHIGCNSMTSFWSISAWQLKLLNSCVRISLLLLQVCSDAWPRWLQSVQRLKLNYQHFIEIQNKIVCTWYLSKCFWLFLVSTRKQLRLRAPKIIFCC